MAKIAIAYLRLGLSFDQIGFIMAPFWDAHAQPSLLFSLFRHHFHLTDDELNKFAIGSEYNFQVKKWRPREVIIRSTPCPSKQTFLGEEKDLQINRFGYLVVPIIGFIIKFDQSFDKILVSYLIICKA